MAEPTRGPTLADGTNIDDDFQQAMFLAREAWTAETVNFDDARDDQRFYAGEQWLVDAKNERTAANRPCMTFNRLPGFVKQVTGDVRKDTPSIKVAPSKDGASEEVAEIYNGIIRNIEDQSNAKAAYVQGVENACITGLGAFRVKTVYSSDDAFEQDIRIERICDPFQVLWDPAAREPDKSDARYVFVFQDIPKEVFVKQFPDAPASSMPSGPYGVAGLIWYSVDSVRVAEYWYKKPVKKTLLLLADGRVITTEEALKETKNGQPIDVQEKRVVESHEICMKLMCGVEFLTKENPWAGKYIPICPVIGEEIYIEGRVIRRGMVRDAKDAQRAFNYMRTTAIEAAALQPKMPWIVTKDMIKNLEGHWGQMGAKNLPYAIYNPDKNAPGAKPERAQPALAQAGLDSQAEMAGNDLQAIVGIYNVSLGAPSTEKSGRAILARQKQGDTGTYNYVDNLGTSIRFCGKILVDLIPKIYDTPRIVKTIGVDGTIDMAHINHPMDRQGNPVQDLELAVGKMNDLSVGEYDVTVITGPSFATKRMEASETLQHLASEAPDLMKIAGDIILKNMDFPGAEEVAARWARTIPENIKEDTGPLPPDPEKVAEAAKLASEVELNKAKAEGQTITNIADGVQLMAVIQQMHVTMQAVQAQLAGLASTPPAEVAQLSPIAPQAPPAGPQAAPEVPPQGPMPPPNAGPQLGELEPMQ